jgi:hypothetical protein
MTFMNRGMQNKRQRTIVVIIIGIVLVAFMASIIGLTIGW